MSLSAALLGQMLVEIVENPDEPFDLNITRDQALAVIQGCTTCEARVFAARLVCLVLDEAARFAALDERQAA
jgi:hypothetical protein